MTLDRIVQEHVTKILVLNRGNITHSAKMLDIGIRTLQRMIKRFNLTEQVKGLRERAE